MKKFVKTLLSVAFAGVISLGVFADNTSAAEIYKKNDIAYADYFVFEKFTITKIDKKRQTIHGDIIASTSGETGEGIYLDKTYARNFKYLMKHLKPGDVIEVTYDKEDYYNEIWDNILHVQIVKY